MAQTSEHVSEVVSHERAQPIAPGPLAFHEAHRCRIQLTWKMIPSALPRCIHGHTHIRKCASESSCSDAPGASILCSCCWVFPIEPLFLPRALFPCYCARCRLTIVTMFCQFDEISACAGRLLAVQTQRQRSVRRLQTDRHRSTEKARRARGRGGSGVWIRAQSAGEVSMAVRPAVLRVSLCLRTALAPLSRVHGEQRRAQSGTTQWSAQRNNRRCSTQRRTAASNGSRRLRGPASDTISMSTGGVEFLTMEVESAVASSAPLAPSSSSPRLRSLGRFPRRCHTSGPADTSIASPRSIRRVVILLSAVDPRAIARLTAGPTVPCSRLLLRRGLCGNGSTAQMDGEYADEQFVAVDDAHIPIAAVSKPSGIEEKQMDPICSDDAAAPSAAVAQPPAPSARKKKGAVTRSNRDAPAATRTNAMPPPPLPALTTAHVAAESSDAAAAPAAAASPPVHPHPPATLRLNKHVGGLRALSRDEKQTIRECKRSIQDEPGFVEPYVSCERRANTDSSTASRAEGMELTRLCLAVLSARSFLLACTIAWATIRARCAFWRRAVSAFRTRRCFVI